MYVCNSLNTFTLAYRSFRFIRKSLERRFVCVFSLRSVLELIHSMFCAQYINGDCEETDDDRGRRTTLFFSTYHFIEISEDFTVRACVCYLRIDTHTHALSSHAKHYSITGLRKFPTIEMSPKEKSPFCLSVRVCAPVCVSECECVFSSFIHGFVYHTNPLCGFESTVRVCECVYELLENAHV